jgi:hypothetical protein
MRAELSSTPGIIIFVFHLPSLSLSKNYRVCAYVSTVQAVLMHY